MGRIIHGRGRLGPRKKARDARKRVVVDNRQTIPEAMACVRHLSASRALALPAPGTFQHLEKIHAPQNYKVPKRDTWLIINSDTNEIIDSCRTKKGVNAKIEYHSKFGFTVLAKAIINR